MKGERIPCSVPYCRRTAAKDKFPDCSSIICGKHWRLGDPRWRQTYRKAYRLWKATGNVRYAKLLDYCWERVLRQAVERSAGITS